MLDFDAEARGAALDHCKRKSNGLQHRIDSGGLHTILQGRALPEVKSVFDISVAKFVVQECINAVGWQGCCLIEL